MHRIPKNLGSPHRLDCSIWDMHGWLWDLALLLGGFCSGAFLALLLRSWLHARLERRALGALIDQLAVVRPTSEPHPADDRARAVIDLWSDQAAAVQWMDHRVWHCNKRMVIDVAQAYGKQLTDVRISQAAQIISRLLSEDLGQTLSVLERYMTVHRVMQMRQYWEKYQELSEAYPALGPGLKMANRMRVWGMRAYRIVGRKIPQLLFFEAAGSAAMFGAREYFASLIAELTGRVGLAAVELYSGSQITISEQSTVQAGLEILLLEQLACAGEAPGEAEREVIASHADRRGLPGDKLGPVVAELSKAQALADPVQLALRIEGNDVLEESFGRLTEMLPEGSAARQARVSFVEALRGPLAEISLPDPQTEPVEEADPPATPEALLQLLWQDVRDEPALPTNPPEGAPLEALLENNALFVRATDLWRLDVSVEQVTALMPKLRKALWLAGSGEQDAQLPAAVIDRLASLLDVPADPFEIVGAFRKRFEKTRHSWLSIVSPSRIEKERLGRFVEDKELVAQLLSR